jgi:hypothetical protein
VKPPYPMSNAVFFSKTLSMISRFMRIMLIYSVLTMASADNRKLIVTQQNDARQEHSPIGIKKSKVSVS